ncbi:MAG: hypothetical protein U1D55_10730 [Phycisphaerae bacterium]
MADSAEMKSSGPVDAYCLLDNVQVDADLTLGHFVIRRYSRAELEKLGTPCDDVPTRLSTELGNQSDYAWALTKVPVERSGNAAVDAMFTLPEWLSLDFILQASENSRGAYYFENLIRTLNLLKPHPVPVQAATVLVRSHPHLQTREQLTGVPRRPRTIPLSCGEGDPSFAPAPAYPLGHADVCSFERLNASLELLQVADQQPLARHQAATHLQIAMEWLAHADREFSGEIEPFDAVRLLLAYDAVIEALVLKDRNNQGNQFKKRIVALATPIESVSEYVPGNRRFETRRVTREDVERFAERVWRLRSKAAHGSFSINELNRYIQGQETSEIPADDGDRDAVPAGPWDCLFLKPEPGWPAFLGQVREIARQCIRRFIDDLAVGKNREQTLRDLDSRTR